MPGCLDVGMNDEVTMEAKVDAICPHPLPSGQVVYFSQPRFLKYHMGTKALITISSSASG